MPASKVTESPLQNHTGTFGKVSFGVTSQSESETVILVPLFDNVVLELVTLFKLGSAMEVVSFINLLDWSNPMVSLYHNLKLGSF